MLLYRTDDVAKMFNVHRVCVALWARKGILRGRKMGKLWLFTEEDIERFKQAIHPPGWYSATELAKMCNVSWRTITRWADQGYVERKKVATGKWVYRLKE